MTRSPWIEQPKNSLLCGHIAIAVIAGESLSSIIAEVGHCRALRTRQIIQVLRRLRFNVPDSLVRGGKIPSCRAAVVNVRMRGHILGHWVAAVDGVIYDGVYGEADGRVEWPEGAGITSYLPVEVNNGTL